MSFGDNLDFSYDDAEFESEFQLELTEFFAELDQRAAREQAAMSGQRQTPENNAKPTFQLDATPDQPLMRVENYEFSSPLERAMVLQRLINVETNKAAKDRNAQLMEKIRRHFEEGPIEHVREMLAEQRAAPPGGEVRTQVDPATLIPDYIEAPMEFGDAMPEGAIRKNFAHFVTGNKFDHSHQEMTKLPLHSLLAHVSGVIRKNKLSERGAFELLAGGLTGDSLSLLRAAQTNNTNFRAFFNQLQALGQPVAQSPSDINRKIDLLKSTPPDNLPMVLSKIITLRAKLNLGKPMASRRANNACLCRQDLLEIPQTFYPHVYLLIRASDSTLRRSWVQERQSLKKAGKSPTMTTIAFDPLASLTSIIVRHCGNTAPVITTKSKSTAISAAPQARRNGNGANALPIHMVQQYEPEPPLQQSQYQQELPQEEPQMEEADPLEQEFYDTLGEQDSTEVEVAYNQAAPSRVNQTQGSGNYTAHQILMPKT